MHVRHLRGAAVTAALVLVLAACSGAGDPEVEGETASSPTPSGAPTSAPSPGVPAVDDPGPRQGRLWSADILVQWDKPIDDATVRRIERLEGVARTERVGLGQVSVEGRVLTVAAVDPRTYRHFTRVAVADAQEVWERVAGGEVAVEKALARRLQDDEGQILLGIADDAPSVHVGAHAPQVPTIDLVVNTAWAERLSMDTDNGLLISTGAITPSTIRRPLARLVGEGASVQMLDIASRLGLDPDAVLTAVPAGATLGNLVGTFGYRVADGQVRPDRSWVAAHIRTEQVPILGSVTCHKDLFPQLRAALAEVVSTGLADEIDPEHYAGCYYPRFIANTTTLSNHAFGLALDLNVPGNLRGSAGEMDRAVVAIFKRWGFAWGGDWSWTDPMHFELAEVRRPG